MSDKHRLTVNQRRVLDTLSLHARPVREQDLTVILNEWYPRRSLPGVVRTLRSLEELGRVQHDGTLFRWWRKI